MTGGHERYASTQAGTLEGGRGPREPVADDQNVNLPSHLRGEGRGEGRECVLAVHSSTIRRIAPRAALATSSATRTSNTSSRSEVSSFSSVIFFM